MPSIKYDVIPVRYYDLYSIYPKLRMDFRKIIAKKLTSAQRVEEAKINPAEWTAG